MDKEYKMVRVKWTDSVSYSTWMTFQEAKELKASRNMFSVGYLLKEDDDSIVVAANKGKWNVSHTTVIPKEAIIDMKEIKC